MRITEYTIQKLAGLAGISSRTLRYYDEIGLLPPLRVSSSGYRIYGEKEVDTLQQILFYRALGVELGKIQSMLSASNFDRATVLEKHLHTLIQKRKELDQLIQNARNTVASIKGEYKMSDKEKFEGLKERLITENEQNYGVEIRKKYGDMALDVSNEQLRGLSIEQYEHAQRLEQEIASMLCAAVKTGEPGGKTALQACAKHEEWLRLYYPAYTREYHAALGEMYAADERFAEYYNKITPGCAVFLRDAIRRYCQK